jgi:hypothetical protein
LCKILSNKKYKQLLPVSKSLHRSILPPFWQLAGLEWPQKRRECCFQQGVRSDHCKDHVLRVVRPFKKLTNIRPLEWKNTDLPMNLLVYVKGLPEITEEESITEETSKNIYRP